MDKNTISVIYEDEDVIVVNKPAGMLSQNSEIKESKSILEIEEKIIGKKLFIVHRLDRLTSGVLMLAKNEKAAALLSRKFSDKKAKKTYYAIVHGSAPEKGECENYLFFDRKKDKSYVVKSGRKNAKLAHLSFLKEKETKLENGESVSLLKVFPTTGRSHQIRIQLANIGYPLLGDGKYGSKYNKCNFALHSFGISIDFQKDDNGCENLKKAIQTTPSILSTLPEISTHPWRLFFN